MDRLDAMRLRLSHERARRDNAKSPQERQLRSVWVTQIEKEIETELKFLGKDDTDTMSDEELLRELKR